MARNDGGVEKPTRRDYPKDGGFEGELFDRERVADIVDGKR